MELTAIQEAGKKVGASITNAYNATTDGINKTTSIFSGLDTTSKVGIAAIGGGSIFAGAATIAGSLVKNPTAQKVLKGAGFAGLAVLFGGAITTAVMALVNKNKNDEAMTAKDEKHAQELQAKDAATEQKLKAQENDANKKLQQQQENADKKLQQQQENADKKLQEQQAAANQKLQQTKELYEKNIDTVSSIVKMEKLATESKNRVDAKIQAYTQQQEAYKKEIAAHEAKIKELEGQKLTGQEAEIDELKTAVTNLEARPSTVTGMLKANFKDEPEKQISHNGKIEAQIELEKVQINAKKILMGVTEKQKEVQEQDLADIKETLQKAAEEKDNLTNPDKQEKEEKLPNAA